MTTKLVSRVGRAQHQRLLQSLYHRFLSPGGAQWLGLHPSPGGLLQHQFNFFLRINNCSLLLCRPMQLLTGHYQYHHSSQSSFTFTSLGSIEGKQLSFSTWYLGQTVTTIPHRLNSMNNMQAPWWPLILGDWKKCLRPKRDDRGLTRDIELLLGFSFASIQSPYL